MNQKNIILFDGVCNLCNSSVQFIIKRDKKNKFLFATLQSDVAQKYLLHKNSKNSLNSNFNTIYLIKNKKKYSESTAILFILKELSFPINLLFVFIIVPKFLRDFFYKIIAKNRYKWFGKKDACMVPTKEYLVKFIS